MYVASLRIQNYRCFRDTTVEFQPGLNVIVGENNSGKTALLSALALIFNRRSRRRPDLYDFYQGGKPTSEPPTIEVTVTLRSSANDTEADRSVVATWLTRLDAPWEATLTYRFFLPEKDAEHFRRAVGPDPDKYRLRNAAERYLPKYVSRVYGGNPDDRIAVEPYILELFDYHFVDALRDVEAEMFSGSSPLLRRMLTQILGNDTDEDAEHMSRRETFDLVSMQLEELMRERLDVEGLFQLVSATGAADGGELTLSGRIDEGAFIQALKLFVTADEFELPVVRNGLGYNNLVYISLLLASMDLSCSVAQQGQNAVLFPMLVVEEPEAHLHPALQYKLLRFLRKRLAEAGSSRQVFITTHSTQITSACGLDDIVCLVCGRSGEAPRVAYPGRVFGTDAVGMQSKRHFERFLDATKSNMLFAKGLLLVEGTAELLLVAVFAEALGLPLDEHHVAVVSVDGSSFKHFLPLFGACASQDLSAYALQRNVACLVDADPSRRPKNASQFTQCWPYQLGTDTQRFDYQPLSGVVTNLQAQCSGRSNLRVFHGQKTLEYDLAHCNPRSGLLVTDACRNAATLRSFCDDASDPGLWDYLRSHDADASDAIAALGDGDSRAAAQYATFYLMATKEAKGSHAFELAAQLRERLDDPPADRSPFNVPAHIESAIRWVCLGDRAEDRA